MADVWSERMRRGSQSVPTLPHPHLREDIFLGFIAAQKIVATSSFICSGIFALR